MDEGYQNLHLIKGFLVQDRVYLLRYLRKEERLGRWETFDSEIK